MGIQVHAMQTERESELFSGSGATWTRIDAFHWDMIEPANSTPSEYAWSEVKEDALMAAAEAGAETIAVIQFTPYWAQKYPGFSCGPVAEEAWGDFAEFVGEVVSRYSQAPYDVRYWEIGNEPDIDHRLVPGNSVYGCWGEQGDPYYGGEFYGEMLKAVYPAIKGADPDARLLVGGLLMDCDPHNPPETAPGSGTLKDCTPSRFLEGILEAGAGDAFDGVSFHAYDYYYGAAGSYGNEGWRSSSAENGPALIAKTNYLKALLDSYGNGDKELLNTEVAVLCGRDGTEPVCKAEDFADSKAYYVAQSMAAALAEGLTANVWYSLTGWRGSGLVDGNGQPTPAYRAFQFAEEALEGATLVETVEDFTGVAGYKFMNKGKGVWLVWSMDGEAHKIQLPSAYQFAYDVFGEPVDAQKQSKEEFEVTSAPVYLEWIE
jgi:hypothetical protein